MLKSPLSVHFHIISYFIIYYILIIFQEEIKINMINVDKYKLYNNCINPKCLTHNSNNCYRIAARSDLRKLFQILISAIMNPSLWMILGKKTRAKLIVGFLKMFS